MMSSVVLVARRLDFGAENEVAGHFQHPVRLLERLRANHSRLWSCFSARPAPLSLHPSRPSFRLRPGRTPRRATAADCAPTLPSPRPPGSLRELPLSTVVLAPGVETVQAPGRVWRWLDLAS